MKWAVLVIGCILCLWLWLRPSETTFATLPRELEGSWKNVSNSGGGREYLRLGTVEIVRLNTNGYTGSLYPYKITIRDFDKPQYQVTVYCRNKNEHAVLKIIRKGDDLIHVSEVIPTGYNDDTSILDLGYFARAPE